MDMDATGYLTDEVRREIAICKLTGLLADYRTIDLEAFVNLLAQQHQAIKDECNTASGSMISALYTEE